MNDDVNTSRRSLNRVVDPCQNQYECFCVFCKGKKKNVIMKRNMIIGNTNVRRLFYLFSRGTRQYKCGKNRQGVFGVCWPTLDRCPHGQAEHRHGLGQWEGLIVLFRVPTQQTWTPIHKILYETVVITPLYFHLQAEYINEMPSLRILKHS